MVKFKYNNINPVSQLKSKQKGVVLVVSLVFLIALTAVAAALMQNTTTDIKMAGASQEKSIAIQETLSEMDRVIFNEVGKVNVAAVNKFSLPAESFDEPKALTVTKADITIGSVDIANSTKLEIDCPPSRSASSTDVFSCNILRVVVERKYGRNKNSKIEVNTGIAQQLFKKGA